jgi:hypothetical protein
MHRGSDVDSCTTGADIRGAAQRNPVARLGYRLDGHTLVGQKFESLSVEHHLLHRAVEVRAAPRIRVEFLHEFLDAADTVSGDSSRHPARGRKHSPVDDQDSVIVTLDVFLHHDAARAVAGGAIEGVVQSHFVTDAGRHPSGLILIYRLDHHGPAQRFGHTQRLVKGGNHLSRRHRDGSLAQNPHRARLVLCQ